MRSRMECRVEVLTDYGWRLYKEYRGLYRALDMGRELVNRMPPDATGVRVVEIDGPHSVVVYEYYESFMSDDDEANVAPRRMFPEKPDWTRTGF